MAALSMADGYTRLTVQPQAVIVHVDVGTQGLGPPSTMPRAEARPS